MVQLYIKNESAVTAGVIEYSTVSPPQTSVSFGEYLIRSTVDCSFLTQNV